MKTALNAWSVCRDTDFAGMFREVHEAGFDGIELNLDEPGRSEHSLTMETGEDQLKEIRELSEKYQLSVVSISSSMHGSLWGRPEEENRRKAQRILRRQTELAQKLGADAVLVVPGGMGDGVTLLSSWQNSIRGLSQMKEELRGCGVRIGLENVWNGFFTSPFDMIHFLEELDSPQFGVYFDCGNMHAFSWIEYWAQILAGRIVKVHVKGCRRNGIINQGVTWCDIPDSDIAWEDTVKMLKNGGFDGYLTAETGKYSREQSWPEYYRMICTHVRELCRMAEGE